MVRPSYFSRPWCEFFRKLRRLIEKLHAAQVGGRKAGDVRKTLSQALFMYIKLYLIK
jgi:hypothetical protein